MTILDQINKRFGDNTIYKFGQRGADLIPVIPTGCLSLDIALGVGGLPRGRIVEIYGPEASGKTTLCLNVLAQAQQLGNKCAYIDVEQALDPYWVKKSGVNLDELSLTQPDSAETALEITEMLVRSGEVDIIIVDSVAALVPEAEIKGDMGDSHMAVVARLMSQAMRKLTPPVKQNNVLLIFTNQLRSKIGVSFGDPNTTTGGNALKYFASVRLDSRKVGKVDDKDGIIGDAIKVTVKKNKVGAPYKLAQFVINHQLGLWKVKELVDLGVELGIIKKGGAWYTLQDEKFQGENKLLDALSNSSDLMLNLENTIRHNYQLPIIGGS